MREPSSSSLRAFAASGMKDTSILALRATPEHKRHNRCIPEHLDAALRGPRGSRALGLRFTPGRKEAMPNIEGSKHFVLGTDQVKVPDGA